MPSGVYIRTEKHKKEIGLRSKGKKHSEETKRKISESSKGNKRLLGYKHSEESKKKMSEIHKGKLSGFFGKHHSQDTRIRIGKKNSVSLKGKYIGNKNSNWQDGKSFEPYIINWTKTLKQSIRQRDKYICQICKKEPAIYVHHIDYDKKNCNTNNLITLCSNCHTRTNFNRNYWINYFTEKIS